MTEPDHTTEKARNNTEANHTQSTNATKSTTNETSVKVNQITTTTTSPGINKFKSDNVTNHIQTICMPKIMKLNIFISLTFS